MESFHRSIPSVDAIAPFHRLMRCDRLKGTERWWLTASRQLGHMEGFTIERRNRLRSHYTITSNVLLFGYPRLSDGAKITYQVIDSFDWTDAAGTRKGFAYPSLRLLARIRGVERRSVRRHIAELEGVKLITRIEQNGQPSLIIIEDPSVEETEKYLNAFAKVGEDNLVRPTPDKNVRPYKEEKGEEKQNCVNEEQALSGGEKPRSAPSSDEAKAKREYLAQEMLSVLKDEHSLGYYRKLAESAPQHKVFEALSIVKQMSREGRIRKTKAATFVSLMKRSASTRAIILNLSMHMRGHSD